MTTLLTTNPSKAFVGRTVTRRYEKDPVFLWDGTKLQLRQRSGMAWTYNRNLFAVVVVLFRHAFFLFFFALIAFTHTVYFLYSRCRSRSSNAMLLLLNTDVDRFTFIW